MDYYIGEIRTFAGNYAPEDWQICDGSSLLVNDYQVLFATIGFTYGGNGTTTFNLPDLRGKLVVGTGVSDAGSTYVVAGTGGTKTTVLDANSLPSHSHSLLATTEAGTASSPNGNFLAASVGAGYPDGVNLYCALPTGTTPPNAILDPDSCGSTGQGTPHENLQPYISINYIIAIRNGLYPTPD